MARPARSIEERRAEIIDAQDHLSEEEKKKQKEEEERKRREREAAEKAEKERQGRQIAEDLARKAAEGVNPLERGAQRNLRDFAQKRKEEEEKKQREQIAANIAKNAAENANPLEKAAEQNLIEAAKIERERKAEEARKKREEAVAAAEKLVPKNNGKQGLSDQIYDKISKERDGEEEAVKKKYIPGTKQALSDSIFQKYLEAEKYYNSEEVGDDFWKAVLNRFRSVPGETAEDFAFLLSDYLPGYKPAQDVIEKNTAGQIGETADRQFAAAKEKTGDTGDFMIDTADALTRMLSNAAFFGKGNIALSQGIGSGLEEYRQQREEEGTGKLEALLRGGSTGAAGYFIERLGGIGGVKDDIIKAAVPGSKILDSGKTLSLLASIGKNALEEGGEEFAEAIVNGITDMIADMAFRGEVSVDFNLLETIRGAGIGALIGGGFGAVNYGANSAAEIPVPFDGKAVPGSEAEMVAAKIEEIENRPISEAEKAAKMEEVMQAVAGTTGTAEVIAEAEKFKNIHEQKVAEETKKELANKRNIRTDSTDVERYEILKKESINIKPYNSERISEEDRIKFSEAPFKDAKKHLKNLLEKFGLFKGYLSEKANVEFEFSRRNLNESANKQGKISNDFANMLVSTDDIVKNAVLVEAHEDKYKDTVREDATLLQVDVFLSAFSDGEDIVPVKMEVKEFKNKDNSLYVLVTLEKIKMNKKIETEIVGQATQEKSAPISYPVSNISLTEIVSKINPNDGTMLKYLPDEMLDIKQREGKYEALKKEEEKINRLKQTVISPISGINTPPSIGNNVFGAGIFGGQDFGQNVGADDGARSLDETVTPSMERANKNLNAQDWKNLAEGIAPEFPAIWRMKDFARALDSAAGGNKVLRQQLFELYEKPLNEAQGNYARNYAEKAKSISEKFKELGIKADSKESAAVQRIGEGVKEIDKKGNTVPYTLNDLKTDFPDSWKNIKAGADYCREIYDEFLHDLNEMYSEIYPATVEEANARISGYNDRIKNDAEYINRYNEVIGKLEEQKIAKQTELSRKRPNSLIYAELQNQIANIDRRIEIANRRIERIENRKLTKEISRDTLQAQIENGEILKNKQIKPRKDYFRHFQELTDEFAEIADIFSNDQRIPPNLAGKSETTKPRTIWTSIAQSRSNNNYYTEDAVSGLLKYTEIAEKLLVFDPLISHYRDVNSAIRAAGVMADNEVKGKGTNAGQFASWADDITNQLAGKTNAVDRLISDKTGALGRATMKAVEALNRRVKSNAILGNFRSALVQIGNLPNAALYIQNPVDWTMGAISLTNSTPEIIEARSKSNFMNRRYMGDTIDALTKEIQQNKLLDKPKEFALWMLGAGDKAAAELIWHTAYSQAVRNPKVLSSGKGLRGYENAVDYADDITRRSIGGRAEGDIPYWEESKIVGLIAPFQIEVANTFNAFTEQIGKKNAAGIIGFEIGVWLINTVLEGIIGDRPLGLDYIDAIWDIVAEAIGDDEEEEKDFWDIVTYAGGRIAGETLSGMPLGAQIGDLITGGDEQKAEDWFGDSDPTRYGTGNIGMGAFADAADYFISGETPENFYNLITDGKKNSYAEWAEPVLDTVDTFAPLFMKWGGKQTSRTLRGIDQLIQGGAYGESDEGRYLKFPQEYDPESIIKTVLFGQYASDRGQEYIDSGFSKKLSEKQTEQMKIAEPYGISNEEFYDIVLGLKPYDKKAEKQQALFENEDLDNWEKSVMDYILFGNPTKGLDAVVPEREYSDEEAFYRSGLDESGKRLFDAGYSREVIETVEKVTTKSDRKADDIKNIQKALDCSEAEAFEILQKQEGKWFDWENIPEEDAVRAQGAFDYYGMNKDEYLKVLNYSKYGVEIEKEDGTMDYSTAMKDVVPNLARVLNVTEERAEELFIRVNSFDYSREDLEDEQIEKLQTAQDWYEVEDKGYFVAKNAILVAEGEKDKYGNTIEGSTKAEAIENIMAQLGVDKEEATIYYLAASGDLILSVEDLSSSHREDLEIAMSLGWTEEQYIAAVNIIKVAGVSKKDDILKALTDAGAPYEMAQGYYNLRENKDYDRYVGTISVPYGMSTKKQADKIDYFIANYNADGKIKAEDLAKWVKATKGMRKKADWIAALIGAGAPRELAEIIYKLMTGKDKKFNNWYKENGG